MSLDLAYLPRLGDGVELLGELKSGGFVKPAALIRRADGILGPHSARVSHRFLSRAPSWSAT
jgi:hypothetical protein